MICVSITEKNPAKIIEIANSAEMAEIRIDLCQLTQESILKVFSNIRIPTIATCRPNYCDDVQRIDFLQTAIRSGAKYVDIEIESLDCFKRKIKALAKENGCKCIISYHNYENTPENNELEQIIADCFKQGADIAKVATTANSEQDSARILSLYEKYNNIVALAMGEKGKITRVANLMLGSPFSFAAIDEYHCSAIGQMTVSQMKKMLEILKIH